MTAFLIIRNKASTRAHVLNLVQAFLFGCVLRVLCMLAVLLLTTTASRAQQFAAEWMTVPNAADSHCQWFRHTFVADSSDRLRRASVCVATDSRFVLYVNGRNVSTSLFMPGMVSNDIASTMADNSKPVAITYDVSRFLRPDSNTVALLVAPEANSRRSPSVAVGFFGTTVSHYVVLHGIVAMRIIAIKTLGCNAKVVDFGAIGGCCRHYRTPLCHDHVAIGRRESVASTIHHLALGSKERRRLVTHPSLGRLAGKELVRVTLRGCRRGERISIGGLDYVCSGEIDEQAYSRFSPRMHGDVVVEGDQWFRPEQIQQVEAICMK